jgi:hypothetical protein
MQEKLDGPHRKTNHPAGPAEPSLARAHEREGIRACAGLVRAARHGREMVYELTPAQLEQARLYLDEISERWDQALERLRTWVED